MGRGSDSGAGGLAAGSRLPPIEASGESLVVPDAQLLFTADYTRVGDDLLLTGADGTTLVIQNYFALDAAPILFSPDGAMMAPQLVATLVASQTPRLFAQVGEIDTDPPIGQVQDVVGTAAVIRDGVPVTLLIGDPVFQNDVLQTGLESELAIGFADGTIFTLAANARITLDGMIYDPAGSDNSLVLSIVQGTFSFITGQIAPTGEMLVKTPVATIGIRGTFGLCKLASALGPLDCTVSRTDGGPTSDVTYEDPLTGLVIANLSNPAGVYQIASLGAPVIERPATVQELFEFQTQSIALGNAQVNIQLDIDLDQPFDQPASDSNQRGDAGDAQQGDGASATQQADAGAPGQTGGEDGAPLETAAGPGPGPGPDQSGGIGGFDEPEFVETETSAAPVVTSASPPVQTTSPPPSTSTGPVTLQAQAAQPIQAGPAPPTGAETLSAPLVASADTAPPPPPATSADTAPPPQSSPLVNAGPVAVADTAVTSEDTAVVVPVLVNDSDPEGDPLSLSAVTQGANGGVAINPNGTATYTPNANFNGADSFTYTVTDGNGGSATTTVNVTVNPVNDAPLADSRAVSVAEDSQDNALGLIAPSDVDGDALTITAVSLPDAAQGAVTLADGSAVAPGQVLTPAELTGLQYDAVPNVNGAAGQFVYSVFDGTVTVQGTVDLDIVPQNDPPVLGNNELTLNEGDTITLTGKNFSATDADDPDADLVFTVAGLTGGRFEFVADPGVAVTSFTQAQVSAGEVQFVHDGGEAAPAYTVTVSDGTNTTAPAAAAVTFTNLNDAPVAQDDALSTDEDTAIAGSVLADNGNGADSDLEDDPLGVMAVNGNSASVGNEITLASGALLTLNANGTFDYDPNGQFENLGPSDATDSFTYTIDDGNGGTDTATATVTITGVNDAPLVDSQTVSAAEDSQDNALGLIAPSDVDGDVLTITVVSLPGAAQGTVTLADGSAVAVGQVLTPAELTGLQYDAVLNASGAAGQFVYSVFDGTVTVQGTVDLDIVPQNDPPVIDLNEADGANFIEQTAGVSVDTDLTLTDADSLQLTGATVSIDNPGDPGDEFLDVIASGTPIGVSFNAATGVLTLSGAADVGVYEQVLRTLTYFNSADDPTLGGARNQRTIRYVVNDGIAASAAALAVVDLTALNDAPVNKVPGAQSVAAATDLVFSGANALSIADADAGAADIQVTLSVANGILSLVLPGGLLDSDFDPTTIVVQGTQAEINTALAAGVTYTSNAGFVGADTLTIVTDDLGNTGSPGALSDTDTIAITVGDLTGDVILEDGVLVVGDTGTGTFSLSGGASLLLGTVILGNTPGGIGTLDVTGAGTALNVTAGISLTVGASGTGTLNINSGAAATVGTPGSDAFMTIGDQASGAGAVTVNAATLSVIGSGGLTVGNLGTGTLRIENGAIVESTSGPFNNVEIGLGDGGTGTVMVTGAGSTLRTLGANNTVKLAEGVGSTASLTVETGGTVRTAQLDVGRNGLGTATIDGGAVIVSTDDGQSNFPGEENLSGFVRIGRFSDGEGVVNVINGGLLQVRPDLAGTTTGTIVKLGRNLGSSGTLIVDGLGSRVEIVQANQEFDVGNDGFAIGASLDVGDRSGLGRFEVTNQATASVTGFSMFGFTVGGGDQGSGSVLIDGVGSNLTLLALNAKPVVAGLTFGDPSVTIGERGTGDLTVANGGIFSASAVAALSFTIAAAGGSTGTLNVQTGSQAIVNGDGTEVVVGDDGDGFLNVSGGGGFTVNGLGGVFPGLIIGGTDSSAGTGTGTVTVTGAGSTLALAGDTPFIEVGNAGTGTLNVESGGAFAGATFMLIGRQPGGVGTLNLSGNASSITMSGTASAAAAAASATTTEGQGAFLSVGPQGTGTLNISAGADFLISVAEPLGDFLGAGFNIGGGAGGGGTGTINVDGAGSTLRVSASHVFAGVGKDNIGDLNITNGGLVELLGTAEATMIVGDDPGAVGTVTVDGVDALSGAPSTLTVGTPTSVDSAIFVGGFDSGFGRLNVSGGATLNTLNLQAGRGATGSLGGLITITDPGTTVNLNNDFGIFSAPFQNIGGFLRVGRNAGNVGEMEILNQAVVNITSGAGFSGPGLQIAQRLGSTGTVLVDNATVSILQSDQNQAGAGSAFIQVGRGGTGALTIQNGGGVNVDSADGVFVALAQNIGSDGSLLVTGAGSSLTVTGVNPFVSIGSQGIGTLDITLGGAATINGGSTIIADAGGSRGEVHVGVGSQFIVNGSLTVGLGLFNPGVFGQDLDAIGLLAVHGGTVTAQSLVISSEMRGVGTVTVDAGGSLTAANGLSVGAGGQGTLNILDGTVTINGISSIATRGGSTGLVTLRGPQARFDVNDELTVGHLFVPNGDQTNGTLQLFGGGATNITGNLNVAANDTDIIGTVLVSGMSSLAVGGTINVGTGLGTGSLTIVNGLIPEDPLNPTAASLTASAIAIGANGTLNLGKGSIDLPGAAAPGTLTNNGILNLGQGPGLQFINGTYTQGAAGVANLRLAEGGNATGFLGTVNIGTSPTINLNRIGGAGGARFGDTMTLAIVALGAGSVFDIANGVNVSQPNDGLAVALIEFDLGGGATAFEFTAVTELTKLSSSDINGNLIRTNTDELISGNIFDSDIQVSSTAGNQSLLSINGDIIKNNVTIQRSINVTAEGNTVLALNGDTDSDFINVGQGGSGTATLLIGSAIDAIDLTSVIVGDRGTGQSELFVHGTLTVANALSSGLIIGNVFGTSGRMIVDGGGVEANTRVEVGLEGDGFLDIRNGGVLHAAGDFVFVGNAAGSSGAVNVAGDGSQLLVDNALIVANGFFDIGTGFGVPNAATLASLDILDGGSVSADIMFVGNLPGAAGAVLVDGDGTTLTVGAPTGDGSIYVGRDGGTGTLTVSGGALLEAFDLQAARSSGNILNDDPGIVAGSGSDGTIIITDPGTLVRLSSDFGAFGPPDQDEGGFLRVGRNDGEVGRIEVLNQARVEITAALDKSAPGLQVARNPGSQGTLIVDNAEIDISQTGPRLSSVGGPFLQAGRSGDGTIIIRNSGEIKLSGDGSIVQVSRGNSDQGGTDPVVGQGLLRLEIGGKLIVDSGANPNNANINVGQEANANGAIIVDGTNDPMGTRSEILLSGGAAGQQAAFFNVGLNGIGAVDVLGGARILIDGLDGNFPGMNIGGTSMRAGGTGAVKVKGAGSEIEILGSPGILNAGRDGTGTLNVEEGGSVSGVTFMTIGQEVSSDGRVTVDGSLDPAGFRSQILFSGVDSTNQAAFITIGRVGTALLDIKGGAQVLIDGGTGTFAGFQAGRNVGGIGTITVDGAGSNLTIASALIDPMAGYIAIGRSGTGALNITDGGTVTNAASGVMFIGGDLPATPGTGTVLVQGTNITTLSTLNAGAFLLVGMDFDFTTGTPLGAGTGGAGTLTIGEFGVVNADQIFVGTGGVIEGTGAGGEATPNAALNGAVTIDGGTVDAGFSAGTLGISGDFVLRAGVMDMELGGTALGQSDLIDIAGAAQVLGGRFDFQMIDGYVPTAGDEIVILNAAGGLTANAQDVSLAFSGVSADFRFEVNFGAESVTFTALNDAAPGTSEIFLGGDLDDTYQGGDGDDLLFGGGGVDILFGNAGADTLTGGSGADIFALGAGDGGATLDLADVITDFEDGLDTIGLTGGLTFTELTIAGNGAGGAAVSISATAEILVTVDGILPSLLDDTDFTVIV